VFLMELIFRKIGASSSRMMPSATAKSIFRAAERGATSSAWGALSISAIPSRGEPNARALATRTRPVHEVKPLRALGQAML
jgi:hypothetical protein